MAVKADSSDKPKTPGKHKKTVKPDKAISSEQNDFYHLAEDIISNISVGIYIVQKSKFIYASPLFQELGGYSSADLVGTKPLDYVHPDDREMVRAKAVSSLKGESTAGYEYRFFRKNKKTLWILETVSPIEYRGERAVLGSFMDITAHKQTEEALQRSEEKYRTILETMQEGYFEVDLAGNFTYFNDSTCRLVGYSPEEMIGMNNRQYTDELYAKKLFQAFNEVYKTGQPTKAFDWQIIRKDGTKRFVEASVSLHTDSSGRPIGFKGVNHDITERRQAESQREAALEALQKSEEKYRTILETMQEGYFETDLAGSLTFFNDSMCRILGYTKEELMGMNNRQFANQEQSKKIYKTFSEVYKTGKPANEMDWQIIRKDGTKRFGEASVSLQTDSAGKEIGFRGLARDVTERKLIENALRESEEKHRILLEESSDPIFSFTQEGKYTYVNPAFAAGVGKPVEEIINKTIWDVFPKEEADKRFAALSHVFQTGQEKVVELRVPLAGGDRYYVTTITPVKDNGGAVVSAICSAKDITERKQAEETYRNIFLNSQIGLFRTNMHTGLMLDANDAVAQFLGYQDRASLLAEPFNIAERYVDPEDRKKMVSLLQAKGEFQNFEAKFRRNDNSTILIRFSARLVKDKGWLEGVSEDITERTALEAQLQQAQKMESVGRLAGGVAHDFNNMLGVILGHAEMALMKIDPTHPIHNDLTEILKAGEHSADLTRQLLAFARKQTVAPKVLDLNATVEGMLKMLKRLIGEDIHLNWQPEANLWPVNVDPSQIDQIMANLCVNARDAISGVGKMTIETGNIIIDEEYCVAHAGIVPGEYVQIAVSDNGCGMDKEILAHIFEPFFTTKGVSEGTGLGLATVYGAVKQNNGFINAYSEPGQGTTFTIYLPRYAGKARRVRTEGTPIPAQRGQELILIVEDEPAILEIATTMLEMQGYTVLAASTPGEAIRLARENKGDIHLLITDVVMPEMNGRDLAKNLLSLYPNLKRMFMSGYTANVIAHHGVLDEGVYFIQKPFSIKELAAMVRKALDSE